MWSLKFKVSYHFPFSGYVQTTKCIEHSKTNASTLSMAGPSGMWTTNPDGFYGLLKPLSNTQRNMAFQILTSSDSVCLFLDLKLNEYFISAFPPAIPLFSFWMGLFQVSGSGSGRECQWCAHSQQLMLMAMPHASNGGKKLLWKWQSKMSLRIGQCLSSTQLRGENNYKITMQDYADMGSHSSKCQLQHWHYEAFNNKKIYIVSWRTMWICIKDLRVITKTLQQVVK